MLELVHEYRPFRAIPAGIALMRLEKRVEEEGVFFDLLDLLAVDGLVDRLGARPFQIGWNERLIHHFHRAVDLAIGAEYRFKPDNLQALGPAAGLGNALREDDWRDLFIALSLIHI